MWNTCRSFSRAKKWCLTACAVLVSSFNLVCYNELTHTHTHTHTHTNGDTVLGSKLIEKTSEWRPIAIPGVSCRLFWEPCVSCWLLTSVCVCVRESVCGFLLPESGKWEWCVCVCVFEKRVITCLKFCTLTLDPSFLFARCVCVCGVSCSSSFLSI